MARYDITNGVTSTGKTLNYDSMYVSSGGTANKTTVNYGGELHVSSGGTANSTTLSGSRADGWDWDCEYGCMYVMRGGKASNTTVGFYGDLYVSAGGRADNVTVKGSGFLDVSSGGVVSNVKIQKNGDLDVDSGGTALNVSWTPCVGCVDWEVGAKVTFASALTGVYLGYGGKLVSSAATMSKKTLVEHEDEIPSGVNYMLYEEFFGEQMYVMSGGKANSITLKDESILDLWSGGVASDIAFKEASHVFVSSGGILRNAKGDGEVEVNQGGVASNVTLEEDGGIWVEKGGVVSGLTISASGYYGYYDGGGIVESGGKITGRTRFYNGACVRMYGGAIADFNITKMSPGDAVLTNNLSAFQLCTDSYDLYGNPVGSGKIVYTLTVNGDQTNGTYKLAEGASGFDGTISVVNTSGSKLGKVSVGSSLTVSGKTYKLSLSGGSLTVAVSGKSSGGGGGGSTSSDKTAPKVGSVKANITAATNKNVTVTATFSDNVAVSKKLYRVGNGSWKSYSNGVTVTQNDTVYFKAVDTSGNESKIVSYKVTNIDKTPPAKPTSVKANITKATNQTVTVTASFSKDSTKKQYSLDNKSWSTYSNGVKVTKNGTVYFRGVDAVGNVSPVVSYKVTNIDKTPPTKPTVKASTTKATNQTVTVTATFSKDSSKKQYSLNGKSWSTYSSGIKFTKNGTVYFRALDAVGNISTVVSYKVTNIDKTPPAKPTAKASTTKATNQPVTVTATFSTDSSKKQYSLNGKSWSTYSNGVKLTKNGTVYFRGIDAAGNISPVVSYKVTNISKNGSTQPADTTPPAKPTAKADVTTTTNQAVTVTATFSTDSAKKQYSLDGKSWSTYSSGVKLTENGTVYFRGIDAAGNISEIVSYKVTNIDTTPPTKPTAKADITTTTNQAVTVTATFSTDSAKKQYSLDGKSWSSYSNGVKLTENGTVYFRGIDAAGNISDIASYNVMNINKPESDFSETIGNGIGNTSLKWTTGGNPSTPGENVNWGYCTEDGHLDKVCVTSGAGGAGVASSWLKTTVSGPCKISFYYKVQTYGGKFQISCDSTELYSYSGTTGTNTSWQYAEYDIPAGEHTIMFTYTHPGCGYAYQLNGVRLDDFKVTYSSAPEASRLIRTDASAYSVGNESIVSVKNESALMLSAGEQPAASGGIGGPEWETLASNGRDDALLRNSFIGDDGSRDGVCSTKLAPEETDWDMAGAADPAEWNLPAPGDWSNGWEIRAIGDFAGDGKDDIILFHEETGSMVMLNNGNADAWTSIGQLDPTDWFVAGCGDCNGDQRDDLLVRQYSTGMLGYYSSGDTSQWVALGRGVDMSRAVIA